MPNHTLKVVIPMAGLGTRLRPQTWSKPKQLVSVAGKPVLCHLLDGLSSYPGYEEIELIVRSIACHYAGKRIFTGSNAGRVCRHIDRNRPVLPGE
jgi:NDP-sugar pyrophosphorylase family protein